MNKLKEYAENLGADSEIIDWLEINKNHIKGQSEGEHIIDYLISDDAPKRLNRATYDQMKKKTEAWVEKLNKKANKIKESEEDTEIVLDFKDGFKFVKLIGENAYKREGYIMRHCVASYYGKDDEIYSLRDRNNEPHATLSKSSQQIKGKGNGSINPKYVKYVVKFLKYLGIEVRENEMKNLGYIDVSKFKKYLHEDILSNLFDNKYHYLEIPLKDKDGNYFACFDLLEYLPMFEETRTGIKFAVDLKLFFNTSINFLQSSAKQLMKSSGEYAKIGSSGYDAQIGSSGYDAQIGSSGHYAQIGSSGHYAQIGSSGHNAKIGSSGDYAQIGSSGDNAKIGSSGEYAKIGSSGYDAKIGSSGHYAQIGSSGHNAKIGSSGDYAQIGSSGNYAQIGSSGDNAKIGSSGEYAVCSAIGIDSKIKAKKGSWITLAEYDKKGKPICVKSAQIDGKILKEDVWYKLKNKKFTEVEEND